MKYYLIKHKKALDSVVLCTNNKHYYMLWRVSERILNGSLDQPWIWKHKIELSQYNWEQWMEAISSRNRTTIITENFKDVERFIFMEAL